MTPEQKTTSVETLREMITRTLGVNTARIVDVVDQVARATDDRETMPEFLHRWVHHVWIHGSRTARSRLASRLKKHGWAVDTTTGLCTQCSGTGVHVHTVGVNTWQSKCRWCRQGSVYTYHIPNVRVSPGRLLGW